MFRIFNLSRCQPTTRNLLFIAQRYQQTSSTSNPSSATKNQTTSSSSSNSTKINDTVKAIIYGVALGLSTTLLYAEYDNDAFRRKVESKLPLSSTILNGLDKIIDPIFGRKKKLTTIISEHLPDQKQIDQAKDVINDAYDKLPEYKKVKNAVTHATDQVKEAVHTVRDVLPDTKTIKKTLTNAKEHVEDAAKAVKDVLPTKKGVSGEQTSRGNDPIFLEEPGEVVTQPPLKHK